ncbi:hypothetical protein K505DRAFT_357762 [Melanomma pulvis-pyrius CBS 109.77]|uniref:Uncharacterized protein n=1 Tax=Melanomma pulvis-pyrius CBS 109.77 TaxID=1314802 RepID=A0A6A6XP59_9PLEO|nr:hypothetical protein K505DRAFT_357762 [Melanomma pulvis-pyrius CBS 109.77]
MGFTFFSDPDPDPDPLSYTLIPHLPIPTPSSVEPKTTPLTTPPPTQGPSRSTPSLPTLLSLSTTTQMPRTALNPTTSPPNPTSTSSPRHTIPEAPWERPMITAIWCFVVIPCALFLFWRDVWKGEGFRDAEWALERRWGRMRGKEIGEVGPRTKGGGKGKRGGVKEVGFVTTAGLDIV